MTHIRNPVLIYFRCRQHGESHSTFGLAQSVVIYINYEPSCPTLRHVHFSHAALLTASYKAQESCLRMYINHLYYSRCFSLVLISLDNYWTLSNSMADIPTTTGLADFVVDGKTYQTYYVVYGDLKASGRRPLVGLHGGPGFSHHYMMFVPFFIMGDYWRGN